MHINFKIDFGEHDIITLFKKLDVNFDGSVSKQEMIDGFKYVGVNCENEVDAIMENLDIDQSGSLDFSELKIVLVDWEKEIKKKTLAKVFKVTPEGILYDTLKEEITGILPSEWTEFGKKVKVENNYILPKSLKEYIKSNIVY